MKINTMKQEINNIILNKDTKENENIENVDLDLAI